MDLLQPADLNAVRLKRAHRAYANPFDQMRALDDAYLRDHWAFYCKRCGLISFEQFLEIHYSDDREE